MLYHNCIDNLWLISTSENTGQGKGNIDPVLWLRPHTLFGERLFEAIDSEGGLNHDTVLYTVGPRKIILANYVKEWFRLQYKELIVTPGYTEFHVKQPFRERVTLLTNQSMFVATASTSTTQASNRQLKREKVQVMSELTLSRALAKKRPSAPPDDSPDHHSSSVDSDKAEINEDNLSGMLNYVDPEITSQLTKEMVDKYSKDNKKRKKDDPSDTSTLNGPNK